MPLIVRHSVRSTFRVPSLLSAMPSLRHTYFLLAVTALVCSAQAVEFNDATLAPLKSPSRNDRARVYATMGHITPDETTLGVRQLREAWDFHKAAVARTVMDAAGGQNTWSAFLKERAEWHDG